MKLRELTITNYKSLENVTIRDVPDFFVLVGANSAGKSCVLEILRQLQNCFFGDLRDGHLSVTNREYDRTIEIVVSLDIDELTRHRVLAALPPLGITFPLNETEFFKKLRFHFAYRPNDPTLGSNVCPISISFTDVTGEWMKAVDTKLESARRSAVPIRTSPNACSILNVGRLNAEWFGVPINSRKGLLEPHRLDELMNNRGLHAFYVDPFLEFVKSIRFLDSRFVPSDSLRLGGTLVLDPSSSNLASVVHTLHSSEEEIFQVLSEFTSQLVGDIQKIRVPVDNNADTALLFQVGDLRLRLSQVGTGVGRAIAVAYTALMTPPGGLCIIEEPESHLHPAAQRLLLGFLIEQSKSKQVVISTHSPCIAGSVERSDVYLVSIENGATSVGPARDNAVAFTIARELGVFPSDQIVTDSLVAFVEGTSDENILRAFASKLWKAGKLSADFNNSAIAILPQHGQDNLNFLVSTENLEKLGRPFWVVSDSDKCSVDEPLNAAKLRIIQRVKEEGGQSIFLRKKEIENYLHPAAIARVLKIDAPKIGDFTDVESTITNLLRADKSAGAKYLKDKHGSKIAREMTVEEILEMCRYVEAGQERYEIVELFEAILTSLEPTLSPGKQ